MPRLLGKASKTPLYVGTAVIVAVVGTIALEYYGVIDVAPNFGRDINETDQPSLAPRRTSKMIDEGF